MVEFIVDYSYTKIIDRITNNYENGVYDSIIKKIEGTIEKNETKSFLVGYHPDNRTNFYIMCASDGNYFINIDYITMCEFNILYPLFIKENNFSKTDNDIIIGLGLEPKILTNGLMYNEISLTNKIITTKTNFKKALEFLKDNEMSLNLNITTIVKNNDGAFSDCVMICEKMIRELFKDTDAFINECGLEAKDGA